MVFRSRSAVGGGGLRGPVKIRPSRSPRPKLEDREPGLHGLRGAASALSAQSDDPRQDRRIAGTPDREGEYQGEDRGGGWTGRTRGGHRSRRRRAAGARFIRSRSEMSL